MTVEGWWLSPYAAIPWQAITARATATRLRVTFEAIGKDVA